MLSPLSVYPEACDSGNEPSLRYVIPGTFAHGVIYRVDIEGFSTVSRLYLTSVDP